MLVFICSTLCSTDYNKPQGHSFLKTNRALNRVTISMVMLLKAHHCSGAVQFLFKILDPKGESSKAAVLLAPSPPLSSEIFSLPLCMWFWSFTDLALFSIHLKLSFYFHERSVTEVKNMCYVLLMYNINLQVLSHLFFYKKYPSLTVSENKKWKKRDALLS